MVRFMGRGPADMRIAKVGLLWSDAAERTCKPLDGWSRAHRAQFRSRRFAESHGWNTKFSGLASFSVPRQIPSEDGLPRPSETLLARWYRHCGNSGEPGCIYRKLRELTGHTSWRGQSSPTLRSTPTAQTPALARDRSGAGQCTGSTVQPSPGLRRAFHRP